MPSQWLAVEAGTDLRAHARQIQRSWESLVAGGALNTELPPQATAELRPAIVDSWRRSLATGLDPTDLLPSIEADPSETRERWLEHPLGSLRHVLAAHLQRLAQESNSLVQVTDPSGLTLHLDGPEWLKARAAEMNLVEGARCAETVNGTNGVGTALAADHSVQVFAFEHFSHHHREWVCSGSPVHDRVSGRLVGVLDLSSPWRIAHPRSLELVTTAARTLEQCLLEMRRDQDARLRRRYGDLATKSTDLLVNGEGYVLIGDLAHPMPFDVPESGGEVSMGDGSLAVAEPLGHGEAYLLRRLAPPRARAARAEALERVKGRVHEQAGEHPALRYGGDQGLRVTMESGLSIQSDQRVSAYFEAALDCVIMVDASGRVVEFNPAAEGTFGYSRDEALGRTIAELIVPPSLRERHSTAFARFIDTGQGTVLGRRLELTGMRADGSEFPVELALSKVEGEPLLICGALRDISAAKDAESHLRELADEQAALRRVATLVARESSPQQLFAIVAEQVGRIIDVPLVRLVRYDSDGSAVELIGGWGESVDPLALGTRWQLDGPGVLASVWQSGLPARLDDYTDVPGQAAVVVRQAGMRSSVASPITVEGRLWGAIAVLSPSLEPLPESTEARLADFTELIATAISNTEARDGERRLAEEQAALRRVAELVAREASQVEVFAAVADAISCLLDEEVRMVRYDANDAVVVAGSVGPLEHVFAVGSRVPLGGNNAVSRVFRTGKPVRIDDYREATGPIADIVHATELRGVVATPIVVEGRLWGTMVVAAFRDEPLPPQTESRLAQFTELIATALANAESRAELASSEERARKLADEQAALRRVATLVANESSPVELLATVAEEVAGVVDVEAVGILRFEPDATATLVAQSDTPWDPPPLGTRLTLEGENVVTAVFRTREAARLDDWAKATGPVAEMARVLGIRSSVATPIVVEGRLWGTLIAVTSQSEPLPRETDLRIGEFTELVATAIANAGARDELSKLVEEQAALRRVATLVAEGAAPTEVFDAVIAEVGQLLGAAQIGLARYENEHEISVLAIRGQSPEILRAGVRLPLDGDSVTARILRTGRSARLNVAEEASGSVAEVLRRDNVNATVGAPIVVDGALWGMIGASWRGDDQPPANAEERVEKFTVMVATAIANTKSRAELAASEARARDLAGEQAALRRVATLVAEGASSDELFAAVTREATAVLDVPVVALQRFEPDRTFTMVAIAGETKFTVGSRWPVEDEGLAGMILASGGPATKQDYTTMPGQLGAALRDGGLISAVGVPIVVEGSIWGFMTAGARPGKPIPDGTEERLARFTELVATAIADSHSREQLAQLAYEQAALRRVATLVADGAKSEAVFSAVAHEVAHVFGVQHVTVCRYEPDTILVLSSFEGPEPAAAPPPFPAGHRLPLDVPSLPALVHRTGKPARIDDFTASHGLYAVARQAGLTAAVGVPIIVDGTVWGAVNTASTKNERFPPDAEERLARFTELIATSVSNATIRDELAASRARVIAASDETRQRIERDLHDGAQQQLVTLALGLRATEGRVPAGMDDLKTEVAHVADRLTSVIEELREMSRGIHPAVLTEGGLSPALEALALRSSVPVKLNVRCQQRLPDKIEVAAYYVTSEALTNAAKHANASHVQVDLRAEEDALSLSIRDDGAGGADPSGGSGLVGIKDRVEALGGTIEVKSSPRDGTRLDVEIPLIPDGSGEPDLRPLSPV